MNFLAEITKHPTKFDCLKHPSVLHLEDFGFSLFHWMALIIFACAIFHTLSANIIRGFAEKIERRQKEKNGKDRGIGLHFLYFMAEVEVIFAFWVIPLACVIAFMYDWRIAFEYINTRDYTEPLFVVVILSLTATRPILHVAELFIHRVAKIFGGSLSAWWFTLLTLGPLLGSFITEAGAMALAALLLSKEFYEYQPSPKFAYATLALLFVNISVGGVLTDFASPAVLILAHCWHWSAVDMLTMFGWKAGLGIVLSNLFYWLIFRKELKALEEKKKSLALQKAEMEEKEEKVPTWITFIHILFIVWIVSVSHYPAIFIASFLFFIGFHQATRKHQYPIRLARPMLVGLFLAGLVIHGGLQGWWVVRLLHEMTPLSVMGTSILLTAFNDNTAISFLATLVPNWGAVFQYAIFTGVIAGGGLTVIGNAPNPAGYTILNRHFTHGIQSVKLFIAALIPTIILYFVFFFFGPLI